MQRHASRGDRPTSCLAWPARPTRCRASRCCTWRWSSTSPRCRTRRRSSRAWCSRAARSCRSSTCARGSASSVRRSTCGPGCSSCRRDGRRVGLMADEAREFVAHSGRRRSSRRSEAIGGLSGNYLEGVATLGDRIVLDAQYPRSRGHAAHRGGVMRSRQCNVSRRRTMAVNGGKRKRRARTRPHERCATRRARSPMPCRGSRR